MLKDGQVGNVTLGTSTVAQIVGSSKDRMVLKVFVNTGLAWVSPSPSAPTGVGIPVTTSSPLLLDYDIDGEIVRAAWHGSADSGTVIIGFLEVIGS